MRTLLSLFSVSVAALLFSGCYRAILQEDGLSFYRGYATETTAEELVRAQRLQNLSREQVANIQDIRTSREKEKRSREQIEYDILLIQDIIEGESGQYSVGTIKNHTDYGMYVKIYEQTGPKETGSFVQELYLSPRSKTRKSLRSDRGYVFDWHNRASGRRYTYYTQNLSMPPDWVAGFAP